MRRRPDTKYVVLTSQRSGSTWFVDVLSGLPGTSGFGELFLRPRRQQEDADPGGPRQSPRVSAYAADRFRAFPNFFVAPRRRLSVGPLRVFSYLNELYRRPGAVGFKLMYSQLFEFPSVWAYVVMRRVRVVHLVRRNHLDVVISFAMRKATRTGALVAGEPDLPLQSIVLDPQELVGRMRVLNRNIRLARCLLRLFFVPHIEVAYEDLTADPARFDAVWKFLSINEAQCEPQSNLVKLVQGDHAEVIRNYSEVQEALAETEFAGLLR